MRISDWSSDVCSSDLNYPGSGRRVYPGFLQHAGFMAMNPERHFESPWDFYRDLLKGDLEDAESHRRFYDAYNAVLHLQARYSPEPVRIPIQEHRLPPAPWASHSHRMDPSPRATPPPTP